MSLAQYLALGKSIKNVSGRGRYKVSDQPVAPDFTMIRRSEPRVREAEPEVPPLEETVEEPEPEPESAVAVAVAVASTLPVASPSPVSAPLPVPAPPPAPVRDTHWRGVTVASGQSASEQGPRKNRWFLNLGTERKRAARRSLPPEQRELALGMVAPVKNDLIESDIEVVALPPPATPAVATENWWERMWRRIRAWIPRRSGTGELG